MSIAEPPPNATTTSGINLSNSFIPAVTTSIGGSGTISQKTVYSDFCRYLITSLTKPDLTINGSVINSTFFPANCSNDSSAPLPKLIFVFI